MKIRITNQKEFSRKLREFQRKTELAPGLVAKQIAFEAFEGVVRRTPVDTGWCRANWNIAEGTPDTSVSPPEAPPEGSKLPPPQAGNIDSTKDYPVYYVTNNLPYAPELEAGRSEQMMKGYMIQRTLAAIAARIRFLLRSIEL